MLRRALLAAPLAACAELRAPAVPSRVPPELVGFAPDPLGAGAQRAAALFADEAAGLAGDAGRAARAFALLEGLALDAAATPRIAEVPGVARLLAEAAAETRRSAGALQDAAGEALVAAYMAAAAALARGERAAAEAALPATLFAPPGAGALARLAAPGRLPVAAIATARLEQAMRATAPLAAPEAGLGLQPGPAPR